MQEPAGYIWDYPGFPSIAVSYAPTSDFFYSGHVGLAMLLTLHLRELGNKFWEGFGYTTVAVEFCTMIFLRGHYTIDLIAGCIFAHYFWIVSGWLASLLDPKIAPVVEDL